MQPNTPKQSIAVVGGGMTGITAALGLSRFDRFQVTLLEKEDHLGGLSSWYEWQDVTCDRFYHVVLSSDVHLMEFLRELDLESQLSWTDTESGFYGEGKLVSFSTAWDFLRFPYLSLWQKFRLGLGILSSARIKNVEKIDKTYAKDWLTGVFGAKVYDHFWGPLLRSKLGEAEARTSGAFILATIQRLYAARNSAKKQEKMGHVQGGYRTILDAAQRKLIDSGVRIKTNTPVIRAEFDEKPDRITLVTAAGRDVFDRVLFTIPCPAISEIIGNAIDPSYGKQLRDVEYLGVICVLLITRRSLSPYYVINLLDRELPFTGIIESTNVLSPEEVGGRHLVYLPKYVSKKEALQSYSNSDEDIIGLFTDRLKAVFPDLRDEDIVHRVVFREEFTQPIQGLNFLESFTDFRTPIRHVYRANTLSIKDSTLNNDAAIRVAKEAVQEILND